MNKENINNKEITKQELIESIGEEIDAKIRSGEIGIDMNAVAEIAENLKNEGKFTAGDELRNEALIIWRQSLINQKLEKRN